MAQRRRRSSEPGTTLRLLVLAAAGDECIGVDVDSGALVRAAHPRSAAPPKLFDIVAAPIAESEDDDLEPALPEAVALDASPRRVGRMTRRRAEKLLRPLMHPPREPLLGIPGPAVPFWELTGSRPTMAVVEPDSPPSLVDAGPAQAERWRCRFQWRGAGQELPLLSAPLSPARRLLVALTPPVQGRCYKVVAGLLP